MNPNATQNKNQKYLISSLKMVAANWKEYVWCEKYSVPMAEVETVGLNIKWHTKKLWMTFTISVKNVMIEKVTKTFFQGINNYFCKYIYT